jgi:hypothetical protein
MMGTLARRQCAAHLPTCRALAVHGTRDKQQPRGARLLGNGIDLDYSASSLQTATFAQNTSFVQPSSARTPRQCLSILKQHMYATDGRSDASNQ